MKSMRSRRYLRKKVLLSALAIGSMIFPMMIEAFVLQKGDGYSRREETTARKLMKTVPDVTYKPSKLEDRNFAWSKRKVPRGSDPIHNRRAGNWGRPPGLA